MEREKYDLSMIDNEFVNSITLNDMYVHIPFASCHLHGIFLPPCRTKPATVPGLSATASLVQRLCQKSAFWQSPCVKGAIGQSIFIGGTGNPCEVSTTSNN